MKSTIKTQHNYRKELSELFNCFSLYLKNYIDDNINGKILSST